MPEQLTLSALAPALRPVVSAVTRAVSRLQSERKAGRTPVNPDLMEIVLDKTLDRLRGGRIEEAWWRGVLDWLGQKYVAPDFLRKPALQEWLADKQVGDDLKGMARARIMGGDGQEPEIRGRLTDSYSERTGEAARLAGGPIDVTVAILVAGYFAPIPSAQQPLVGMFQELTGRFDRLEMNRLSALTDPITRKVHTDCAKTELAKILRFRAFTPVRSRKDSQKLLDRVTDGDLIAADDATKTDVRYWTARLCAADVETLDLARQIRTDLGQGDPDKDMSVVDALIAAGDGRTDDALLLLRDRDDPDSRTVLFSVLVRSRGEREALDWYASHSESDGSAFFMPVGWRNWAVCMAKVGRWREAALRLRGIESNWRDTPVLAFVEGAINAAMLLPEEYREMAIETIPVYPGIRPNLSAEAWDRHSRATACFGFFAQSLVGVVDADLAHVIDPWRLWLRLMDPNVENVNRVHEEVRRDMEGGARAVELIPFAYAFGITFDEEPLRRYLQRRKELGGLADGELLAECFLLAGQHMDPRELLSYLEEHKTRLIGVMPLALLVSMHVDAFVRTGQMEKARELVTEQKSNLDEVHSRRLKVLIDTSAGNDPRKQLEEQYGRSNSLIDLKNLVGHLKSVEDHPVLRSLTRRLFDLEPTIGHAVDVVACLNGLDEPSSVIQFLDENPIIAGQSDDLKQAKAWALFLVNRFQESKQINDELRNRRENRVDLQLDVRLAISSGDWERAVTIVDQEWSRRGSHTPEMLLILGEAAAQQGQNPDRALDFAKLAAEKAQDDPRVLANAWILHCRLGREEEANPAWFMRASELSSADEGPVWKISLREIVTDWLPKRLEYVREVRRQCFSGEIPISVTAGILNQSLVRLLLHVPNQNTAEADGRRREMLPIVDGRETIELQEDWTIGLDVTSILILGHLDLLETVLKTFHHVKLAPGLMEFLYQEKGRVHSQQPSLVRAAKQVQELYGQKQIKIVDSPPVPSKAMSKELGVELATLLEMARQDNGKVVCVRPIHRVDSLMEEVADTSECEDRILSTGDICELLHRSGKIDDATYRRAKALLKGKRRKEDTSISFSILDNPLYVDRAALPYLQGTNLLHPMVAAGLDVRLHPRVMEEANAVVHENDVGVDLAVRIDGIRNVLRNAVESGSASFLPRVEGGQSPQQALHSMQSTLWWQVESACDALCIDEHWDKLEQAVREVTQGSVLIVGVLDVLHHLTSQGSISVSDHWTARHSLRNGGFAFVFPDAEELTYWLKQARYDNDQLTESAELRILRQSIARADSSEVAGPMKPSAWIRKMAATSRQVIVDLWRDLDVTVERVAALSDWVWHNLAMTAIWRLRGHSINGEASWARTVMSLRVGCLFLPMPVQSQERRGQYTRWLERSILQRLWPANAVISEAAVSTVREHILTLEDDRELYGKRFLEQLPESVRRRVVNQHPEFADRYGIGTRCIFGLDPDLRLAHKDLFLAVREAFATGRDRSVRDIEGNQVSIAVDAEDPGIVVQWSDVDAGSHRVQVRDLALLSPERDTRLKILGDLIDRLGPAAKDFRYLRKELKHRGLSDEELSAIFDESSNGVAAFQANLTASIQSGSGFITDLVPPSMSYFERFAGPSPIAREAEAYFHEVLVPYRKGLLDRHLAAGLDLCCLGAIRDDLAPGQWVATMDDGVVWEALSSCDVKGDPFSLLGALDIALYRQGDPRFREFAAEAVTKLSDANFGRPDGTDIYRLLPVLAELVLNRINLLENGASYPGYWKRMCAWMQASLAARSLMAAASSINIDGLEEWARGNMTAAGVYAEFVDFRNNPMLFAGRFSTPRALRSEILGRLYILKSRHQSEERQVPRPEEVDRAFARSEFALGFPGPLEGHMRPTQLLPKKWREEFAEAWAGGSDSVVLQRLVLLSQSFALNEQELDRARKAIATITENGVGANPEEYLKCLEAASVVAAASRDTALADEIADAILNVVAEVSEAEAIPGIFEITFQAAAAHEAHDAWLQWLEERMTSIANSLPKDSLRAFLGHLHEVEMVLPIESWFHARAKSIALSGAA